MLSVVAQGYVDAGRERDPAVAEAETPEACDFRGATPIQKGFHCSQGEREDDP